MIVWLPWVLAFSVLAAVIFMMYMFVRHYIEKSDQNGTNFGTILCCSVLLVSVFFTLLLIPIDVYSVTDIAKDGTHRNTSQEDMLRTLLKVGYYSGYLAIILSLTLTLPFAYFYYDASTEYPDNRKRRILSTLKSTMFFILGLAVLIILAFVIKALSPQNKANPEEDWQKRVLGELSNWEAFVSLAVSLLSIIGLVFYIPYVSYGLAVFPIFLIKGRANPVEEQRESLLAQETKLKADYKTQQQEANDRYVQSSVNSRGSSSTLTTMAEKYKYHERNGTTNNSFVRKDHKMRDTERQLAENQAQLNALDQDKAYWVKAWNFLGPFRIVLGIFFLAISLLLIAQQIVALLQRILNSSCGWKCGFSPDTHKVSLPNPIDVVLTFVSQAFPIDLIFFTILIVYLFFVIIYAVTQFGVRIFLFKFANIVANATPANALVLAVGLMAISSLSINQQMVASIPQYSTFGDQFYLETKNVTLTDGNGDMMMMMDQQDIMIANNDVAVVPTTTTTTPRTLSGRFAALFMPFDTQQYRQVYHNTLETDEFTITDANVTKVKKSCTLKHGNVNGTCHITQFASFIQKSNQFLPFLSVVHMGATMVFLGFFAIFFLYALCKKPESDRVFQSDDPDAPNYL